MKTKQELNDYFEECYLSIPPDVLTKAVSWLQSVSGEWPFDRFKALFNEYGLHEWFWHVYDDEIAKCVAEHGPTGAIGMHPHMSFGLGLRNGLRTEAGLLDNLLPKGNWDDYYVSVLEAALGFRSIPGAAPAAQETTTV